MALPDALDQYFLDHPDELLSRPCERLIVDPDNEPVSRAHLVCAAAELALDRERDEGYLERHASRIASLVEERMLRVSADDGEIFALTRRPHRQVHLRGTGRTFSIRDEETDRLIGTVDGVRALHECHPGAIYLHGGRQYLIRELDGDRHVAVAQAAEVSYFTTPLTEKETEILEVLAQRRDGPLSGWLARVKVTERVVGFERKRIQGQETLDRHPLELPPVEYETVGLLWSAGRAVEETLRLHAEHFLGALHASEHTAISLFPLLALCDRNDIGGISYPRHPQVGTGAVFIYDGHPGGVGIAARVFEDLPKLFERVLSLLESCLCEDGCPSCVQSPKCGNGNRPLDKGGAARHLRLLLGREEPAVPFDDPPELDLDAAVGPPPERRVMVPVTAPALAAPALAAPALAAPALAAPPVTPPSATPPPATGEDPHRPSLGPDRSQPEALTTVLFDLETRRSADDVGGWHNIHKMGLAVGVVCFMEDGRFEAFQEGQVHDLIEALEGADLVVGFNVKGFDYRVLGGYTGVDYSRRFPTLDLLEDVKARLGYRLSLGHLATETLGVGKSADGLQSLQWVKEGRLDLVEEYCRRDVEVTRDLYLFGRREGYVLYRDKKSDEVQRLPVEW